MSGGRVGGSMVVNASGAHHGPHSPRRFEARMRTSYAVLGRRRGRRVKSWWFGAKLSRCTSLADRWHSGGGALLTEGSVRAWTCRPVMAVARNCHQKTPTGAPIGLQDFTQNRNWLASFSI